MDIIEIMAEKYGIAPFPDKSVEAMAYVKFQPENAATYSPTQGFASGTMYPTLNKPFYGGKCGVHYDWKRNTP